MIYLCPACGGKLSCDQDMMEGDGGRLKGFVELGEAIECGHCGAKRPAAQWVAPREPAADLADEPEAAVLHHGLTEEEIDEAESRAIGDRDLEPPVEAEAGDAPPKHDFDRAPKATKAARKEPKAKKEPKA